MLRSFAAFASVVLLLLTGVVQADDAKRDLEKLQGTWEIVKVVNSGRAAPAEEVKGGQVVFKGDEMTLKEGADDKNPWKFRVKLYPSQNPKALDATALNQEHKGPVSTAIYRLEGDTLTICSSNDPDKNERPKEFESKEGSKVILLTLKRRNP